MPVGSMAVALEADGLDTDMGSHSFGGQKSLEHVETQPLARTCFLGAAVCPVPPHRSLVLSQGPMLVPQRPHFQTPRGWSFRMGMWAHDSAWELGM